MFFAGTENWYFYPGTIVPPGGILLPVRR